MKISKSKLFTIISLLLFFMINLLLLSYSSGISSFLKGADAYSYYNPAINLLEKGRLVFSNNEYMHNNTPFYSLLIYLFLFVDQDIGYLYLITFQIFLLIFSSIIFVSSLKLQNDLGKKILFFLIIYNPNLLISAHLCQTEILYTFFFITSFYFLLQISRKIKLKYLLFCSFFIACATLTRPIGLYIYYIYALIIFAFFIKSFKIFSTKNFNLLYFIIPFLLMISFWGYRNLLIFDEYFISSNKGYYSYDNLVQFIKITENTSELKSIDTANSIYNKFNFDIDKNTCLQNVRNINCINFFYYGFMSYIFESNLTSHIKAFSFSVLNTYFTGGASNYSKYLNLSDSSLISDFIKNPFNGLSSIKNFLTMSDIKYTLIFFITTFYVFLLRFFSLFGLIFLLKKNEYSKILIFLLILLTYTILFLYVGNSRFRVPLEPILTYLGFSGFLFFVKKKYK